MPCKSGLKTGERTAAGWAIPDELWDAVINPALSAGEKLECALRIHCIGRCGLKEAVGGRWPTGFEHWAEMSIPISCMTKIACGRSLPGSVPADTTSK
jgi:hypothetical protein